MQPGLTSSRTFLRLCALTVFAFVACGGGAGGGGCDTGIGCGGGGCASEEYQYPRNDPARPDSVVIPEATRIRVTQRFIDFIKPELPNLILATAGSQQGITIGTDNVLRVEIPDQDLFNIGIASAKLRDAELLIWLDDLDQKLELEFQTPNQIKLAMNNLRIGLQMDLKEELLGSDASCPIVGTLGMGPVKHAAEISVEAIIDPGVGPDPERLFDIQTSIDDIALNDLNIRVVGSSVYCQEPECRDCGLEVAGTCLDPGGRCSECRTFCGAVTDGLLAVVSGLVDLFRPLLNNVMKPLIQTLISDALGDINTMPAKLETQLSLAELAGIPALKSAKPFGIFAAPEPGRFPVIDRGTGNGLEVTVTGGAEAELADCIGELEPFNMPAGPVPVLGGTDSQGRPYHAAATIASAYINQILYAVHRSGSLCLKLQSEDIKELTGGQFSLNASVLSLLASDLSLLAKDGAPVLLQIKPKGQPLVDFGSGAITGQDSMGNDIFDWLLKLNVEDMGLAFHVLIEDRYVRIFEVTLDVNVGLNLMVLPDNSLEVNVGELRIDDFDEVFNELLPNADFAMVLPTLIDLALQALITNQLKFNVDISDTVSEALGGAPVFLRINDIARDGIQDDYLTLSMTFTSSQSTNLSRVANTYASLHEDDGLHRFDNLGDKKPTGRIRLQVGDELPYDIQNQLEYQIRVDRGVWRVPYPAQPDGSLHLEASALMLPGLHTVEVRARYLDAYETLDPSPVVLEVLVDPFAPELSAKMSELGVEIEVTDQHSPASKLRLFGRLDDSDQAFVIPLDAFEETKAQGLFSLTQAQGHEELTVYATDANGNKSDELRVRVGHNDALSPSSNSEDLACGCETTATHGKNLNSFLLALGLGFGLLIRRRREK
ncbi:MAG: hypothetical protein VYC39_00900 [Myxococcota bacterium]|nr:hypothetical protein [Myxococcota bacterium]